MSGAPSGHHGWGVSLVAHDRREVEVVRRESDGSWLDIGQQHCLYKGYGSQIPDRHKHADLWVA